MLTSRIKTVRAGGRDCPQDNQALQASTEFRIETNLSIVFIHCCRMCRPSEWAAPLTVRWSCFNFYFFLTSQKWHFYVQLFFSIWVRKSAEFYFETVIFLPLKKWIFYWFFFLRLSESPSPFIFLNSIYLSFQKWSFQEVLFLKGIHLIINATPTAAATPDGTPINKLSLSFNRDAVIPIKMIPTPRIWFWFNFVIYFCVLFVSGIFYNGLV